MIATRTMSPILLAAAEKVGTDGILGFYFRALRATPGMVKESLEKQRADNVEALGGQLLEGVVQRRCGSEQGK
jgi:hypothetical protein